MAAVEHQHLSDEQHEALLRSAVQVDNLEGGDEPEHPPQFVTHTVKRLVHVPVEKEVKVPIVTKKVEMQIEKKIVEGTKMVPIRKHKEVTETVLETQEQVVHGFRERWVKIKEPTMEVVKKQIPVTRSRRVSYVDYVEQKVQKIVEVPREVVSEVHGFRVDKHIGTKVVEVEEDVQYEMRPVYLRKGERRVRETGAVYHHGKMIHGAEQYHVDDGEIGACSRLVRGRSKSEVGEAHWMTSESEMRRSASDQRSGEQVGTYTVTNFGHDIRRSAEQGGTISVTNFGDDVHRSAEQDGTISVTNFGDDVHRSAKQGGTSSVADSEDDVHRSAEQDGTISVTNFGDDVHRSGFESVETRWTTSSALDATTANEQTRLASTES